MENGLFSSPEFAAWSANQLMFMHVTTRVEDDEHQTLLKDKGFTGFPSLCFLDHEGAVIAKHSGARDLAGLSKTAGAADAYLALRLQAQQGDKVAEAALFVKNLALGHFDFSEGTLRLAAIGDALSAKLRADAQDTLHGIQMDEMTGAVRAKLASQELTAQQYRQAYNNVMLLFYRANRAPKSSKGHSVFGAVLAHAHATSNVELFEEALGRYRARVGGDSRYARALQRYEDMLADIKAP